MQLSAVWKKGYHRLIGKKKKKNTFIKSLVRSIGLRRKRPSEMRYFCVLDLGKMKQHGKKKAVTESREKMLALRSWGGDRLANREQRTNSGKKNVSEAGEKKKSVA